MRAIIPSATVMQQHDALVSALRAQGSPIGPPDNGKSDNGKPSAGTVFLIAAGETPPIPARTILLDTGPAQAIPFRDGNPARIRFTPADDAVATGFVSALIADPGAPAAADPESLALLVLAGRVAASDITVLINGPTGTGKEVLARTIHCASARRDRPFIAVNCAALPETMLEALLFGHQKGAFTGASAGGQGFFRAAHGGTLLLDEIAEMPFQLQAKLLRALQEREVVPLGSTAPEAVDVRVIACANRDLHGEVIAGRFRADLFYRLSVFPLATRALVQRPGDLAALATTMILRHAGARPVLPWLSRTALAVLAEHDWPGNVRELENVLQRALLLAPGDSIEPEHLVFDRKPETGIPPKRDLPPGTLSNIVRISEYQAIREMLVTCNGSRSETARRLGISERTLRYRLAKARERGDTISEVKSA